MNTLKEICKRRDCGHDKTTHHEGKHNCLGSFCECRGYTDVYADESCPPTQRIQRAAPPVCDPFDGYDDPCPSTLPMIPAAPITWPWP